MPRKVNRKSREPTKERRQAVIAAAVDLLHVRDYRAVTINDIAAATKMVKGSLYYYIGSKEDLLYEIALGVHSLVVQNLEYCSGIPGSPLDRIRIFAERHVRINTDNSARAAIFYRDSKYLSRTRLQKIVQLRDRCEQFLRGLIHDGQQSGSVCPDLDPRLTSRALFGLMNSVLMWYRPDGPLTSEQVAAAFADLVVHAIRCSPEMHRPGHRGYVPVPATVPDGEPFSDRGRLSDEGATAPRATRRQ